MRVLFIVPYTPSLIRVRPLHLLRGVARMGHEVTLAAPWTTSSDLHALHSLADEQVKIRTARLSTFRSLWNCLKTVPSRLPLQAAYAMHPRLLRLIRHEIRSTHYDVIHIEHLRGALYGLKIIRDSLHSTSGQPSGTPLIWDSVDCITHLYRQTKYKTRCWNGRLMAGLDLARTASYEAWLAQHFDRVLLTCKVDADALLQLARSQRIPLDQRVSVLPNGVDLDCFCPGTTAREPATVVLTGKMSYHANVTAARHLIEDIMPLVWERRPDVKVVIVGKDPPGSVRDLASCNAVKGGQVPRGNVVITGAVDSVAAYLQRATVAAAPMTYGAGIQNKVLEAMACGTPVVTTSTAASSLSARHGVDLLVADDAADFATHILSLLADHRLRQTLSENGRRYAESCHNWAAVCQSLLNIYQQAIASRSYRPVCA